MAIIEVCGTLITGLGPKEEYQVTFLDSSACMCPVMCF